MSLILIYVMTLGCSFLSINCLEKIIHEGWLEAPTIFSLSSNNELGIIWIMNYESSWINMMSMFLLFSKIEAVFVSILQKILKLFKIIVLTYPQLRELNWLRFLRAPETSCCASHGWTYISRIDSCSCPLDGHLCS